MENRAGAIEIEWTWTGGSISSKDTCTEILGDGTDAAVKDGAAVVTPITILFKNLWLSVESAFGTSIDDGIVKALLQ